MGRKKRGRKRQQSSSGISEEMIEFDYDAGFDHEEAELECDGNNLQRQLNRRDRMAQILQRDGPECVWCRTPVLESTATTDHVIPKIKGGPSWIENEVAACRRCNKMRGHMMPMEWMITCRNNKGWDPNEVAIQNCLIALDQAVQQRGGQRKARPHLAKQLKKLGAQQHLENKE